MPHDDQNGSEPGVPNHSVPANGGRPPVVTDEELRKLAGQLNDKLGRPPKAAELIEVAGGCQKKRALSAIAELKLDLSQAAVHSELIFPRAIEASLRGLIAQWMEHAADQLAARHLAESERVDAALERSSALIDEQGTTIAQLRESVADRERTTAELLRRLKESTAELERMRENNIRLESICAERQRLLETLSNPKANMLGESNDR